METVRQALKYGVVGAGNTLLTAAVIWVMMHWCGTGDVTSNFTGYVAGLLNSFFWNRRWTFRSNTGWFAGGLRFLIAFLICYLLQLGVLLLLRRHMAFSPYSNQLIAMGVYTAVNFVLNKYFTFKSPAQQ
ncbi:MAG: GtrA family protein [Tannerellaceae bacterium]|jgi:putative flippase GtrA|nr:GtrA family protein [Tannerellaceae bacterium]